MVQREAYRNLEVQHNRIMAGYYLGVRQVLGLRVVREMLFIFCCPRPAAGEVAPNVLYHPNHFKLDVGCLPNSVYSVVV